MINLEEEKKIINLINKALMTNILPKEQADIIGSQFEVQEEHIHKISIRMEKEDQYKYTYLPAKKIKKKEVRYMPPEIGKLEHLDMLVCDHAILGNLPREFCELKKLTWLALTSKVIMDLPDCIGKMEKLETLMLHCELVKTLPESIGDLQNLKSIHIWDAPKNFILPKSILKASNLNSIGFEKSHISEIPDFLIEHPALKKLFLIDVDIVKLPKIISKFKNLETLLWRSPITDKKDLELIKKVNEFGRGPYGEITGEALNFLRDNI